MSGKPPKSRFYSISKLREIVRDSERMGDYDSILRSPIFQGSREHLISRNSWGNNDNFNQILTKAYPETNG